MGCLLAAAWCRVRGAVPGPTCSPGAPHLKAFWSFVSPPLHREHLEGEAGEGGAGCTPPPVPLGPRTAQAEWRQLSLWLTNPSEPRQGLRGPFLDQHSCLPAWPGPRQPTQRPDACLEPASTRRSILPAEQAGTSSGKPTRPSPSPRPCCSLMVLDSSLRVLVPSPVLLGLMFVE